MTVAPQRRRPDEAHCPRSAGGMGRTVRGRGPGWCGRVRRRRGGRAPAAGRARGSGRGAGRDRGVHRARAAADGGPHSELPGRPSCCRALREARGCAAAGGAGRDLRARAPLRSDAAAPHPARQLIPDATAASPALCRSRRSPRSWRPPCSPLSPCRRSATGGGRGQLSSSRSRCSASLPSSPWSSGSARGSPCDSPRCPARRRSSPTCGATTLTCSGGSVWLLAATLVVSLGSFIFWLLVAQRAPADGRRPRHGAVQRQHVHLLPDIARAADRREPLRVRSHSGVGDSVCLGAAAHHGVVARGCSRLRRARSGLDPRGSRHLAPRFRLARGVPAGRRPVDLGARRRAADGAAALVPRLLEVLA